MTASIVGWAHTPFGKFDAETVEGLVVRVANEALADAGISAGDVDEIMLGHFNGGFSRAGFYRLAGAAGRPAIPLQAGDTGGKCLRHRIGGGASGHPRHRGRRRKNRAGGRRRADDAHAGTRDRQEPA